jgi:hypothetical protein
MSRILLVLCLTLALQTTVFSQTNNEARQKEKYEEKVEENKQKYIQDFLKSLDVDAFQKEIIYQSIDTYFDEVTKIQTFGLKSYEMKDEIDKMRRRHFADVRTIVSEEVMQRIEDAVTGKWDPKKDKKKQKKSRRNK